VFILPEGHRRLLRTANVLRAAQQRNQAADTCGRLVPERRFTAATGRRTPRIRVIAPRRIYKILKIFNPLTCSDLRHFLAKKSPQFPRKSAYCSKYDGYVGTPALFCLRPAMLITKYTPPHAQTPSFQALSCLYSCRVRSTNPPYLKKQTQFPRKSNAPNLTHNKNLRPIGYLVTRDKANPNKRDSRPLVPVLAPSRQAQKMVVKNSTMP